MINLDGRIEKYDLTVREIIGKLSLEFLTLGLGLLLYDIERALKCDHKEARRLYDEFVNGE